MRNKKLQIWLPLILSGVLIAGMYFGFRLRETTPSLSGFLGRDKRSSVQEIMDLVRNNYVDSVRTDSMQYNAIQEMINGLDPHSVYIPSSQLQKVNEDIEGNFGGIGIEFNIFSDTIHVLYVLPGGPSDKAGLKVGDRILRVDTLEVAGRNVPADKIRSLVRGERGTPVTLQVIQANQKRNVTITRGSIPVPAVEAAYMADDTTAYIKLVKFSESSYREFMESLEGLQKSNTVKKLVLDLRDNGGGLLDQAVNIVDEFIDGEKLIVYFEGTHSPRREYKAKRPGLFESGEVIVLINEMSASASEVVAGALQDWDRGTIIGRRSFGKGLVQDQFRLSDGSALRLTIARYYTPVGRSIQRPYENGKQEYIEEIWERYSNGELINPDSNKVNNGKTYRTVVKKRPVYGGGGIMPDVFVSIDTSHINPGIARFLYETGFNSFVYNYYMKYRAEIEKFSSARAFYNGFKSKNQIWNDLVLQAAGFGIDLNKASERDKNTVYKRFMANLARYKWRNNGFYEVLNSEDPVYARAVEIRNN